MVAGGEWRVVGLSEAELTCLVCKAATCALQVDRQKETGRRSEVRRCITTWKALAVCGEGDAQSTCEARRAAVTSVE